MPFLRMMSAMAAAAAAMPLKRPASAARPWAMKSGFEAVQGEGTLTLRAAENFSRRLRSPLA